jgi:hypothetical protein
MVGVDVSVHAPPSARGPLRGPQGEPGPRGPQGQTGPPGDPAELLAPLSPGDALSVDDAGDPVPVAVMGKLPPGGGNRIVVTNDAGIEVPYAVRQQPPANHAIVQRTATGQAVVADAVNANEAASKGQLDRKARKPLGANCIPALDASSAEIDLLYAEGTNGGSIAKRTSTGAINVSDGLVAQNAVNKGQLDGRLSAAQRAAIDALPTTGATVDQVVAALRAT